LDRASAASRSGDRDAGMAVPDSLEGSGTRTSTRRRQDLSLGKKACDGLANEQLQHLLMRAIPSRFSETRAFFLFLHFANGIPGAGGRLLVEFTNVIDHLAVVRQFARRAKGDVGAKLGDIANCGYYRVDVG